jgi:cell division protein ZipA
VAEFRWLLAAVGILVLAAVFWFSRREIRRDNSPKQSLQEAPSDSPRLVQLEPALDQSAVPHPVPQRIVAVRLMARAPGGFDGGRLLAELHEANLHHGRLGIFHRPNSSSEQGQVFSVASLVEPGSFDLSRMSSSSVPGVSIFLQIPGPTDAVAAFDVMLATAHQLASRLDGDLLDEKGNRLSVQRERYLREEVIQFSLKLTTP